MDVRIPVMATMTSQGGSILTLTKYIQRKGAPTMLDATAYTCVTEPAEHQDLFDENG